MQFPIVRMRRLRQNKTIRNMVRENHLRLQDLIMPLFVSEVLKDKEPISSMPGQFRYSLNNLIEECKFLWKNGIKAVLLFGIPQHKDEKGSSAIGADKIIQQAIKAIKDALPDLLVIPDICLCEYTSHGHCGLISEGKVDNDATLDQLAAMALSCAEAGADWIAPSDMMDGRVKIIRETLDQSGYSNVSIMSYAAKFSSAYYGPFREAAESSPQFGDRKTYQMDPANGRQALREIELDIEEGADIVMVKPALSYMDIIYQVKQRFLLPIAAYNVSGEYSLIKAAAEKGWINEQQIVLETLLSIKRAGADIILTYFAKEIALWHAKNHILW